MEGGGPMSGSGAVSPRMEKRRRMPQPVRTRQLVLE